MGERLKFGDKLPKNKHQAASMFPDGDDLPIFSGTPIQAEEKPFVPEDHSMKQTALPGMPPIDYDHIREKDRAKKRGRIQPVGRIFDSETFPEPPEDTRQAALHEALAAYNLNTEALRRAAQMGQDLNELLRTGEAPEEIQHLITALSAILRPGPRDQIKSPADAAACLMIETQHLRREQFRGLFLDTKNRIQSMVVIYQGTIDTANIRPIEAFDEARRWNSAAAIFSHNHPSSDPTPSPEDSLITCELVQAGKVLGVDVLDHLVIGAGRWVSLRERGLVGFEKKH